MILAVLVVAVAVAASLDESDAIALPLEAARVRKACPTAVPAFVNVAWWPTAALVSWDIHRKRAALWDNEHVVFFDLLCAQVFGAMDTTTDLLESLPCGIRLLAATGILDGDRATFDDTDEIPRMIVPGPHFTGREEELSCCHCGRPVNEF